MMDKWIKYHFKINWPKEENPRLWIDYFICDTVIRDIIENKELDIKSWRIHRRWADQKHVFAIHLYISDKLKQNIEECIKTNKHYKFLNSNDLLDDLKIEDQDISDFDGNGENRWTALLKRTFPLYIQRISETLLDAINDIRINSNDILTIDELPTEIAEIKKIYINIEQRIRRLWQTEGNDLLHHFHAVFGYN